MQPPRVTWTQAIAAMVVGLSLLAIMLATADPFQWPDPNRLPGNWQADTGNILAPGVMHPEPEPNPPTATMHVTYSPRS